MSISDSVLLLVGSYGKKDGVQMRPINEAVGYKLSNLSIRAKLGEVTPKVARGSSLNPPHSTVLP
jgi:hypothetical protein